MTHLSKHDLWSTNGNRVTTMEPGPDDLFVVTMIGGKRALVDPVGQYARALRVADAFARRLQHHRRVTIRVLPMTAEEFQTHIGWPHSAEAGGSPTDEASDRTLVIDTCMEALRQCNEPAVRADAHSLLVTLGVIAK